jgi:hypothetical protein
MKLLLVVVALVISGCAAQVVSSSERSVIVRARMQEARQAQDLAEAECAKHHLHARLSMLAPMGQWVYDCVP